MKLMKLFLKTFLVFLAGLEISYGQHQNRFILNVFDYIPPNLSSMRFRCTGTLVTLNDLLVPASCVTVVSPRIIEIEERTIIRDGHDEGVNNFYSKKLQFK